MDFWIKFWTILFLVSLILFSSLSIVVAIGGIFDIRFLFKKISGDIEKTESGSKTI